MIDNKVNTTYSDSFVSRVRSWKFRTVEKNFVSLRFVRFCLLGRCSIEVERRIAVCNCDPRAGKDVWRLRIITHRPIIKIDNKVRAFHLFFALLAPTVTCSGTSTQPIAVVNGRRRRALTCHTPKILTP